jgi:hypothetical protein
MYFAPVSRKLIRNPCYHLIFKPPNLFSPYASRVLAEAVLIDVDAISRVRVDYAGGISIDFSHLANRYQADQVS